MRGEEAEHHLETMWHSFHFLKTRARRQTHSRRDLNIAQPPHSQLDKVSAGSESLLSGVNGWERIKPEQNGTSFL